MNKMTNSIKKNNYSRQKHYINLLLMKKPKNNNEAKIKNGAKLELLHKPKKSVNMQCFNTSLEKISKALDKNSFHSTIHKINNFKDFSNEIKKTKMKIKKNIYPKISKVTSSFCKENKKSNNDPLYLFKGGTTNRNNFFRKKESSIEKDNFSSLTQRQQFIDKLNKQRIFNSAKEKNNSFLKNNKKNNLYLRIMENRKKRESRNNRYISPNNNNNNNNNINSNYLVTEVSDKKKKKINVNYSLLNRKKLKNSTNNSINKEKKKTPDIIKKNYINHNSLNIYHSIKKNKNSHESIRIKSLVLDLDETLIFTSFQPLINSDICFEIDLGIDEQNNSKAKNSKIYSLRKMPKISKTIYLSKRPYLELFLSELYPFYEICVFSASSEKYASPIIDIIDTKKVITKKFFRKDCLHLNNSETFSYIKDLEKIDKNYNDIIIIDDNVSSFVLQKENGIPIKSWRGDQEDIELLKLIPILKNLSGFYDVRTEIKQFVINRTFIWFQGIKWLLNNCLSYTYMKEIIEVMKIDQIPIADKLFHYFTEDKVNNSINSNNNDSYIGKNFNKMNINSFSLKQNNLQNLNLNKKQKNSIEKRKRGKSANFNNVNDNKQINNLKFNINNNEIKRKSKSKINNHIFNRRKNRSKSAFQNKDLESEKCITNKILENLKKKRLKIKNIKNLKKNNNDIYIFKRRKNSYSISYN